MPRKTNRPSRPAPRHQRRSTARRNPRVSAHQRMLELEGKVRGQGLDLTPREAHELRLLYDALQVPPLHRIDTGTGRDKRALAWEVGRYRGTNPESMHKFELPKRGYLLSTNYWLYPDFDDETGAMKGDARYIGGGHPAVILAQAVGRGLKDRVLVQVTYYGTPYFGWMDKGKQLERGRANNPPGDAEDHKADRYAPLLVERLGRLGEAHVGVSSGVELHLRRHDDGDVTAIMLGKDGQRGPEVVVPEDQIADVYHYALHHGTLEGWEPGSLGYDPAADANQREWDRENPTGSWFFFRRDVGDRGTSWAWKPSAHEPMNQQWMTVAEAVERAHQDADSSGAAIEIWRGKGMDAKYLRTVWPSMAAVGNPGYLPGTIPYFVSVPQAHAEVLAEEANKLGIRARAMSHGVRSGRWLVVVPAEQEDEANRHSRRIEYVAYKRMREGNPAVHPKRYRLAVASTGSSFPDYYEYDDVRDLEDQFRKSQGPLIRYVDAYSLVGSGRRATYRHLGHWGYGQPERELRGPYSGERGEKNPAASPEQLDVSPSLGIVWQWGYDRAIADRDQGKPPDPWREWEHSTDWDVRKGLHDKYGERGYQQLRQAFAGGYVKGYGIDHGPLKRLEMERPNPAASPEQYRLAQAVLSGTARETGMPVEVAREIVERTPDRLRSQYSRWSNPISTANVKRLLKHSDATLSRMLDRKRVAMERAYRDHNTATLERLQREEREIIEARASKLEKRGNPAEWLPHRVRPGDDPLDRAFDAGKYWARIGAYGSGVSNANVRKYGFNRWYNDQSPSGMYREGPPRRKLKKSTLERAFNDGYRIGKEEGRRSNPADAAADLYREFHGVPSSEEVVVTEEVRYHGNLAGLGDLVEIVIKTPSGYKAVLDFDKSGVILCSSEDGKQLYLRGGDQSIDLDAIHMSGDEWLRDSMLLGMILKLTYRTAKKFDSLKVLDYEHKLGEESGVRPELLYDVLNNQLSVAGGQYDVRPEGVVN